MNRRPGTDWRVRLPGRPRERNHVEEYPLRLDAVQVRRAAIERGIDPREQPSLIVRLQGIRGELVDVVPVEHVTDPIYGVRLWLLCPRCGARRRHLYPTRSGVRCRGCGRIRYGGR